MSTIDRSNLDPEVRAYLEGLEKANALLKAQATQTRLGKLSLKVSEKGGLSVYGLGRFPVTLYKGQWLTLMEHVSEIKAFLDTNGHLMSEKAVKADDAQEVA